MKTKYLNIVAGIASFCITLGCCPERRAAQNWDECVAACNLKEDVIINQHRACINNAVIAYNAAIELCADLAPDAARACRRLELESFQRRVTACDETFDRDLKESRMCTIECTKIHDDPPKN